MASSKSDDPQFMLMYGRLLEASHLIGQVMISVTPREIAVPARPGGDTQYEQGRGNNISGTHDESYFQSHRDST